MVSTDKLQRNSVKLRQQYICLKLLENYIKEKANA